MVVCCAAEERFDKRRRSLKQGYPPLLCKIINTETEGTLDIGWTYFYLLLNELDPRLCPITNRNRIQSCVVPVLWACQRVLGDSRPPTISGDQTVIVTCLRYGSHPRVPRSLLCWGIVKERGQEGCILRAVGISYVITQVLGC